MVRSVNTNKKDELVNVLKKEFPNLKVEDLENMNDSVEELINTLSLKVGKDKKEIEKLLEDKLDWINSKHLI